MVLTERWAAVRNRVMRPIDERNMKRAIAQLTLLEHQIDDTFGCSGDIPPEVQDAEEKLIKYIQEKAARLGVEPPLYAQEYLSTATAQLG